MLCSYFMGLNLSNRQIADELELSTTQAREMAKKLRQWIASPAPFVLEREVECDEVGLQTGAISTKPFVTAKASTPEMKMETDFTSFMSIRWKESSPSFVVGYAHTAAFLQQSRQARWNERFQETDNRPSFGIPINFLNFTQLFRTANENGWQ